MDRERNIVVENISLTSKAKNAIARNLSFRRNTKRGIASYNLNSRCPFDGQKHRISRAILKHTFHINIFIFVIITVISHRNLRIRLEFFFKISEFSNVQVLQFSQRHVFQIFSTEARSTPFDNFEFLLLKSFTYCS